MSLTLLSVSEFEILTNIPLSYHYQDENTDSTSVMSDSSLESKDEEIESKSDDIFSIKFDDENYGDDQMLKWVVDTVVEIADKQDGDGIMCTLKIKEGLQPGCTHVRFNLEMCTKHFETKLVQHLDVNESEKSKL